MTSSSTSDLCPFPVSLRLLLLLFLDCHVTSNMYILFSVTYHQFVIQFQWHNQACWWMGGGQKFSLIKTLTKLSVTRPPGKRHTPGSIPPLVWVNSWDPCPHMGTTRSNLYKPLTTRSLYPLCEINLRLARPSDGDNKTQLNLLISNYGGWASHKITHPPATISAAIFLRVAPEQPQKFEPLRQDEWGVGAGRKERPPSLIQKLNGNDENNKAEKNEEDDDDDVPKR